MTQDPTRCLDWIPTQYRPDVLLAIARSVCVAHDAGPARWGLSLYEHSLMLKVGPHEVLQIIEKGWSQSGLPVHLIVDRDLVPASVRARAGHELAFSDETNCYGREGVTSYYPSNPGTEACNFTFSVFHETYQTLDAAHVAVIRRAAGLRLNPATRKHHSSALVSFLAAETGHNLAQPAWLTQFDR